MDEKSKMVELRSMVAHDARRAISRLTFNILFLLRDEVSLHHPLQLLPTQQFKSGQLCVHKWTPLQLGNLMGMGIPQATVMSLSILSTEECISAPNTTVVLMVTLQTCCSASKKHGIRD